MLARYTCAQPFFFHHRWWVSVAIGGSSLVMGPMFVWCQHHGGWLYGLDEVLMCQSRCVEGVTGCVQMRRGICIGFRCSTRSRWDRHVHIRLNVFKLGPRCAGIEKVDEWLVASRTLRVSHTMGVPSYFPPNFYTLLKSFDVM